MTIGSQNSPNPIIILNGKGYHVHMLKGGKEVDLTNIKISTLQKIIKQMIPAETSLQSKITIHSKGSINNTFVKGKDLKKLQKSFRKISTLASETLSNQQIEKPKKLNGKRFTCLKISILNCAKRAFKSIAKTFNNVWRKVVNSYQKIFTPEKYQEQQLGVADSLYDNSKNRLKDISNDETTLFSDETAPLKIDPKIKKKVEFNLKEKFFIKEKAIEGELHKNIAPLTSGGIALTATTTTNNNIISGEVIPSSFRGGNAKQKNSTKNHLLNCYTSDHNGTPVIRSGVIDTPEKANELFKIARALKPEGKIRLVSHQLNTIGFEKKMIDNQHENILATVSEYADIDIAHFNTQANRLVEYEKMLPGKLQMGEFKSREQNIEGWAQNIQWLFEDLKDTDALNQLKIKLGGPMIDNWESKLLMTKNHFKNLAEKSKQDLEEMRTGFKAGLIQVYDALKEFEKDNSLELEKLHEVKLMRRLLGVQLGVKGEEEMSRGQEIMLMHLLNSKLGVISAMNCKTGADRTGFVHAIKMAQQQVLDRGMDQEQLFNLVWNWDSQTKEINQYVNKHSFEDFTQQLNDNDKWKHVNLFRKHVLENLIKHTLPITIISSGVTGFRWSRGFSQNRHPLNFIPSHVQFSGDDKTAQLVKFDRNGKANALTKEGEDLLLQFSILRGA